MNRNKKTGLFFTEFLRDMYGSISMPCFGQKQYGRFLSVAFLLTALGIVSCNNPEHIPNKSIPNKQQTTLTLQLAGGMLQPPLTGNMLTGIYGAAVPKIGNPTKSGFDFTGWNTPGGRLPATFPAENKTYTAQWKAKSTATPTPAPVPAPTPAQNLIQNADFSQTQSPKNEWSSYWSSNGNTCPKYWSTWSSETSAPEGVSFKVENKKLSITANGTPLINGGVQHICTIAGLATGKTYTLKIKVEHKNATGRDKTDCKGAFVIKLGKHPGGGGKEIVGSSQYSAKEITCTITATNETTISFKGKNNSNESIPLTDKKCKLELFARGLQNKTFSFSGISLTENKAESK